MESQRERPVSPDVARAQLAAARRARAESVRRATIGPELILALSVFCGAIAVPVRFKGPGNFVTVAAVLWFLAELLRMSARNRWRPLQSLPKPRLGVTEVVLICVAVLIGAYVGPQIVNGAGDSAGASWLLGISVAVVVAGCLFGATAVYRRRATKVWRK